MKEICFVLAACFAVSANAEIYKCTDDSGNTSYQAKPCREKSRAYALDTRTGSHVAVKAKEDQKLQQELKRQQQELEKQKKRQLEQQWSAAAKVEQDITLALIQKNPKKFSIYAIPPYQINQLPPVAQQFKPRLPDIERLRRLAAQKALASGQCTRVESDQLSPRSKKGKLIVLVDCSSGKSFYFSETELLKK